MLSPKLIAGSAAVVALGSLGLFYLLSANSSDCGASAVAGGTAAIGGQLDLVDENGVAVTEQDIITGPTLVYFGYTYCTDICPADMARNAEAVDLLDQAGYSVTPVLISVDPGRDKPEVLKEWTDYLHPRMIGLTGTPEQITAAAKAYKTIFRVPEDTSSDDYLVDHMTQTYLMFPETGFVEFFSRDDTAEEIAKTTACYIDAAT